MGLARLFRGGVHKRPEIDAALDAELDRHAEAMRDLIRYRMDKETGDGLRADSK